MSLHNIKPVWMTSVLSKMGGEIVLSTLNNRWSEEKTDFPMGSNNIHGGAATAEAAVSVASR